MPKNILYLVIWANGHEEKFYVENLQELLRYIDDRATRYGLPELIYRKQ